MKSHHLDAGTMCPASARLVNGKGSLFGRARLVCHCLLIETRDGLVLVDTGLGLGDIADPSRLGPSWVRMAAPRLREEETAVRQVRALGYRPSDVKVIVPTHLDLDHAGGIPDFPDARVMVHEREWEAATTRVGPRAQWRYIPAHLEQPERFDLFKDGGDSWMGFEGARELPGSDGRVVLIPLPGHTAGHMGVAVRTGDRWLFHAGDSYFFHGQIEEKPHAPWVMQIFQRRADTDRAMRIANQARVRRMALDQAGVVTVFSSHDTVELERAVA